jgi:hypothetical protein
MRLNKADRGDFRNRVNIFIPQIMKFYKNQKL